MAERKTRLELATPTLARLCSTNWAISALSWAGTDSNCRSREATDLQSARFNHLPTYPVHWLSPDGDSGGIQTHNLLIRSQMLYSVELRSHLSGGRWGIRTPDPLLVRQTLWTSWAKRPIRFFKAPRLVPLSRIAVQRYVNFRNWQNFLMFFFILIEKFTSFLHYII